jgi:23S rRNA pseudouridine1911/1915/1917 synthase
MAGVTVEPGEAGQTLAALVRRHGLATTWNEARRLIAGGKVFVDGAPVLDDSFRPAAGARLELRMRAPRPLGPAPPGHVVHEDSQLVVFDKPAGVASVPYRERGATLAQPTVGFVEPETTALDLIRAHWRREGKRATETPLHIVHRIDKETSGLLVFAKTRLAERELAARFRAHQIERSYVCVVHGRIVGERRIESRLVADRGDGLRGSTRDPKQGKRAVTHVRVVEAIGAHATLCEVRLETGKTHQIRIHLAEAGHPLVGDKVYVRDLLRAGGTPLPSERLLLHARTLGFPHPVEGTALRFESPLPPDFVATVERLRRLRAPLDGGGPLG